MNEFSFDAQIARQRELEREAANERLVKSLNKAEGDSFRSARETIERGLKSISQQMNKR